MRCKDCEYVKCYAVNKKMYYCDNRNRVNLMGKLGEDNLPETSPEWCPMADRTIDGKRLIFRYGRKKIPGYFLAAGAP